MSLMGDQKAQFAEQSLSNIAQTGEPAFTQIERYLVFKFKIRNFTPAHGTNLPFFLLLSITPFYPPLTELAKSIQGCIVVMEKR